MDCIFSSSNYAVCIIGIISNSLSGGLVILSFKLKTSSLLCDILSWIIIVSITSVHWPIIISSSLSGGLVILSFKLKTSSLLCNMLSWIIIVSITSVHWPIKNMLVLSCNMGIWSMIVSTTNVNWGMSRIFRIMTSMSGIWIMEMPTM